MRVKNESFREDCGMDGKRSARAEGVRFTDLRMEGEALEEWIRENSVNMQNGACERPGIVVSPWFRLRIGGEEIPCYAAKTARDPHSFAWVEVDAGEGEDFALEAEIITDRERVFNTVLPESAGVEAESDGRVVRARLTSCGSFTFTFDRAGERDGSFRPLTVMVKRREREVCPSGMREIVLEPGEYPGDRLTFDCPGTFVRFRPGTYAFETVRIAADDVTLYFEPGAVLSARSFSAGTNPEHAFVCYGRRNIRVLGRAALDMSLRDPARAVFDFVGCRDLEFSGFTVVNSNSWTCCFTGCRNLAVRDLLLIGYRTFSDGVMLSDCENARVSGCFVRTGDDALEVKSTSDGRVRTNGVLFEDNAVWTDKGVAYGCIYESNFSQHGVTWRRNSVGYALADWSEHLGCASVSIRGDDPAVEDCDMVFEDLEIYSARCSLATVVMHKGGCVRDLVFRRIRAKEARLNPAVAPGFIVVNVKNEDNKPCSAFRIGRLTFGEISWNGHELTAESAERDIVFDVPEGFPADRSVILAEDPGTNPARA